MINYNSADYRENEKSEMKGVVANTILKRGKDGRVIEVDVHTDIHIFGDALINGSAQSLGFLICFLEAVNEVQHPLGIIRVSDLLGDLCNLFSRESSSLKSLLSFS